MGRYIRFYNKDNDEFAGEIPINIENIDINILQKKYNNNSKTYDPMLYYCYPIKPDDAYFFLKFLKKHIFNHSKFDYFLEYDA
jgi:hypothetical protein